MIATATAPMEVFCTSRLLDSLGSKEEWQRQSGYSMENAARGALKELLDNSLDACEEIGVPPVVTVTLDATGLAVQDNGSGIAPETINSMLDFSVRPSSRAGRCSPTRGQQGNGGQTMLALAFLLGGYSEISSHGVTHKIDIVLDRIAQKPIATVTKTESTIQNGTCWKLCVGPASMISTGYDEANFVSYVRQFAWCNPHLTLRIDAFNENFCQIIRATNPQWQKFRPGDAVPPQWYGPPEFNNRIMSLISKDMAEGQDRYVRDFIGEFRGLKRPAAKAEVLAATGLKGQGLTALLHGRDLNGLATQLYNEVLKHGNPLPDAWKLGLIGEKHIAARMAEECCCDIGAVKYRKSEKHADDDGKPFIVEMAFTEQVEDDRAIRVDGVNWSAAVTYPFDGAFAGSKYEYSIYDSAPVALFVHLVKPGIQSTDRGKSHVVITKRIQEVMDDLLAKVAGEWHKAVLRARRAEESDERAVERARREEPKRQQKMEHQSLKTLIYKVLPGAVEHYRATMGEIIWERQLYYNVRHDVLAIDKRKGAFTQATFKKHLNEWQDRFGDIEGMCNKARGTFVEPHTGRRLPLSTPDVAKYIIPDYQFNKILKVEKQGFEELFDKHKIAQRFDMGIIYDEGYSVDACKALALACQEKGITLYVLHDTDPYGYVIFDSMRRNGDDTNGLDPVDISFSMDECLALGKTPETDYRIRALPDCILPLLTPKTLEVFTGHGTQTPPEVQKRFKRSHPYCWEYGRVELNDLATNPDEFMAEIEQRLRQHGLGKKLVPPVSAIKQQATQMRDDALHDAASEAIREVLDIDSMIATVVTKLKPQVTLNDIPKDLTKWAKRLLPESWKHRIETLIDSRVGQLRAQIAELAEEVINDA
ncbi:MAG: ATP-binding protein [Thermoguttaceae bacterium]|jgi:DNA topoisomerase VI subunit B